MDYCIKIIEKESIAGTIAAAKKILQVLGLQFINVHTKSGFDITVNVDSNINDLLTIHRLLSEKNLKKDEISLPSQDFY